MLPLCSFWIMSLEWLFTPWTMKSSQGLVKIVIGCWTHPGTTSVYTKEKMSKWPWSEYEVHRRHILMPTWSTDMVQRVLRWERQKRCSNRKKQRPMVEKYCYNIYIFNENFVGGREDEDKRRQKNYHIFIYFYFYFLKTTLFEHILK